MSRISTCFFQPLSSRVADISPKLSPASGQSTTSIGPYFASPEAVAFCEVTSAPRTPQK